MSSHDGASREVELIHLPGPSAMPPLVAAGLAVVLVGLYAGWAFSALGGLLVAAAISTWLRTNAREIERMPRRQQAATMARVPD